MIAILGGGIAGISAGYHLSIRGIENTVFERNISWGGLCDNFLIGNGFRFDYFIHLSFSKSDYVNELFKNSCDFISHSPISMNYYKGFWLKHPAQNNLSVLPTEEKLKLALSYINKPTNAKVNNYKEWLLNQFGQYFSSEFSEVYTRKYWTLEANQLTTDWLSGRFSKPLLEEFLRGCFEQQNENFYYAENMRYPLIGGYKSFLKGMADNANIELQKEAVLIDTNNKRIEFKDNSVCYYDSLVSSLPLPELVRILKDKPLKVVEAANKLAFTSGQLVSIGFNKPDIPKNLWFYIYDEDILPARACSPSIKSPNNVPKGKSSMQFETYFSKFSPKKISSDGLVDHICNKGKRMGLWNLNDVEITDYREAKYANVIFDFERSKNLNIIHNYLDSLNIKYVGRFGLWDYLWSDQSLLSGKNIF
jgi:protoporphyrinogen oxidase